MTLGANSNCYIACLIAKARGGINEGEVNRLGLIYCRWSVRKTHFIGLSLSTGDDIFLIIINIQIRYVYDVLILKIQDW